MDYFTFKFKLRVMTMIEKEHQLYHDGVLKVYVRMFFNS